MGQAEGSYRGDVDIVLSAAINKIEDDKFESFLKLSEERGYFDASQYPGKYELIQDLPNLDEALKESLADDLKQGIDPFSGEL